VTSEKKRIVIVGAGVAGLSIAWTIRQRSHDIDVVVLERSSRTGGNIHTESIDGYVCESGPDGFLDNAPATLALVHALGLDDKLLPSNDAARRRYIFRNGRLHEVPASVGRFLRTTLLSTRGKLRLLAEPFATRRVDEDESILDFATRRIGPEAAATLVDPMVSGVFGGDAATLSLKACFPRMRQIEDEHGGLVRGMIATRRSRSRRDAPGAPAGRLTSFVGGMTDLIHALTNSLGAAIHTATPVTAIRRKELTSLSPHPSPRTTYMVTTTRGAFEADAVVFSNPAAESGVIIRDFDPQLARSMEEISYAPLAVVCLGYRDEDIRPPCHLDGFGFLVPRAEGMRILGALWETSIYQHRAPANRVLLRAMIGGARDRTAVSLSDAELLRTVREDLMRSMKLLAAPDFVRVIRHARGIPQYVQGHQARMARLASLLKPHPGLFLAGNSYRGVSINACIADAAPVADAVLALPAFAARGYTGDAAASS
jgi:oxygen-dependent protoporphyrinogen oxidase